MERRVTTGAHEKAQGEEGGGTQEHQGNADEEEDEEDEKYLKKRHASIDSSQRRSENSERGCVRVTKLSSSGIELERCPF
eukprot:m.62633 g.62633  ORF g.62633 m.62633 type:complete len:80 (-) comp23182_c1_seq1:1081-1320(-)